MHQTMGTSYELQKFYKTDFYGGVVKRKDKLRKKLLETNQESWNQLLPITKVWEEYEVDVIVDFLKLYEDMEHNGFELNDDSTRVQLAGKKGSTICDFICVEYFHLYSVSEDKTQIKRFTYFELYYDQYVVSCIADTNMLKKSGPFHAVNLDSSDWAHAQQQMRLWNQYLLPKIEELPIPRSIFPAGIEERIYCSAGDERADFGSQYPCPDIGNPLWEIVTYIRLIQLLPILPGAAVPWYYLNLVCENKADRIKFAENLKVFLEEHFEEEPIINGEVRLSPRLFFEKKSEKESYRAVPYVFVLEKQKDIEQLWESFAEAEGSKRKRKNHPFKDTIPICISDRHIPDSMVLNIKVPDEAKMSWDSKQLTILMSSFEAILGRYRMYKDKKSTRSWMSAIRKEMQNTIGEYCASKGCSTFALSYLVKHQPKMLELMTWFILLQQNFEFEFSLGDNQKLFIDSLVTNLIHQQNSLDNIVDALMICFRKEFDERADKRPMVDNKNNPEEMLFRTTVDEEPLLCFHPKYFPEWLEAHNPNVGVKEVLDCLKARGLLTTSGDKEYRRVIKLKRRDVKQGDKKDFPIDFYAIIMK